MTASLGNFRIVTALGAAAGLTLSLVACGGEEISNIDRPPDDGPPAEDTYVLQVGDSFTYNGIAENQGFQVDQEEKSNWQVSLTLSSVQFDDDQQQWILGSDSEVKNLLAAQPVDYDLLRQGWFSHDAVLGPVNDSRRGDIDFWTEKLPIRNSETELAPVDPNAEDDPAAPPSWNPSIFFRSVFFVDPRRFVRVGERFQEYFENFDLIGIETKEAEVSETFNFAAKYTEPGDAEGRIRTVRLEYDRVCGFLVRAEDFLCIETNPGQRPTYQDCDDTGMDQRRLTSRFEFRGLSRMHPCRTRQTTE